MGSVIERASSGRAKCRACGQGIAKGEERFGEALPNAYGEGESLFWFHLRCAACCRPESLLAVLEHGHERHSHQSSKHWLRGAWFSRG